MRFVVALIASLMLAACASSGGGGGGSDADDDSSLACDHFRNVSADAADGLLTDAELRDKLKEVHSNASIATASVRNAARDMLAAATSGSTGSFGRAISRMDSACSAAGH